MADDLDMVIKKALKDIDDARDKAIKELEELVR